jgi:hypothetical protein
VFSFWPGGRLPRTTTLSHATTTSATCTAQQPFLTNQSAPVSYPTHPTLLSRPPGDLSVDSDTRSPPITQSTPARSAQAQHSRHPVFGGRSGIIRSSMLGRPSVSPRSPVPFPPSLLNTLSEPNTLLTPSTHSILSWSSLPSHQGSTIGVSSCRRCGLRQAPEELSSRCDISHTTHAATSSKASYANTRGSLSLIAQSLGARVVWQTRITNMEGHSNHRAVPYEGRAS